jgi:hypothetical protein
VRVIGETMRIRSLPTVAAGESLRMRQGDCQSAVRDRLEKTPEFAESLADVLAGVPRTRRIFYTSARCFEQELPDREEGWVLCDGDEPDLRVVHVFAPAVLTE